jgi:hypothetical protein
MELPANIPGDRLCGKLLAALKNIADDAFRTVEKISLLIADTGETLGENQTLEDAGVWDGGIVTVVKDAPVPEKVRG